MDNKQEYILCDAYKRMKKRPHLYLSVEGRNDIYDIEIGLRHCDILQRFCRNKWYCFFRTSNILNKITIKGVHLGYAIYLKFAEVSTAPQDSGFYTSFGRYVDRKEGMFIAKKAKQVSESLGIVLFSEDLY